MIANVEEAMMHSLHYTCIFKENTTKKSQLSVNKMSSGPNKREIRSSTLILYKLIPIKKRILKDNFTSSLKTTWKKCSLTSGTL